MRECGCEAGGQSSRRQAGIGARSPRRWEADNHFVRSGELRAIRNISRRDGVGEKVSAMRTSYDEEADLPGCSWQKQYPTQERERIDKHQRPAVCSDHLISTLLTAWGGRNGESRSIPISSTAARLATVALSIRFEAITEDIMTTRTKHRDKTSISLQQANLSPVTTNAIPVSQASFATLETVFGVLSGSI